MKIPKLTPLQWAAAAAAALGAYTLLKESDDPKELTSEQRIALIQQIAMQNDIEPAVALGVFDVESGGRGFRKGRLIIRYEPHIFRRRTEKQTGKAEHVEAKRAGQDAEYDNLSRARAINPHIALESISMGSSQIMGFNHKAIGFPDVVSMWEAFNESEIDVGQPLSCTLEAGVATITFSQTDEAVRAVLAFDLGCLVYHTIRVALV